MHNTQYLGANSGVYDTGWQKDGEERKSWAMEIEWWGSVSNEGQEDSYKGGNTWPVGCCAVAKKLLKPWFYD